MGKKRTRSASTSKGERRNIVAGLKEVRQSVSYIDKMLNKLEAWRKGKNPWITVAGTSTKEPYKRVAANALWGDPKKVGLLPNIYRGKTEE